MGGCIVKITILPLETFSSNRKVAKKRVKVRVVKINENFLMKIIKKVKGNLAAHCLRYSTRKKVSKMSIP